MRLAWFVMPMINIQLRKGDQIQDINELLPESLRVERKIKSEKELLEDREYLRKLVEKRMKDGAL